MGRTILRATTKSIITTIIMVTTITTAVGISS
jgi:hypothetical protein